MGYHADGKISAVLGTHTHVPTADAKILKNGTAYVSDVGMTGPKNSVLGVKSEIILERFIKGTGSKFEVADGTGVFNSVIITFNKNFKPIKIKRIDK
jgi:calcineurin-like phosphoesterase